MFKKLREKRNSLLAEAEAIMAAVDQETRALDDDSMKRYDEIVAEIRAIDRTIEAAEANADLGEARAAASGENENREEAEIREFAQMIRTAKTSAETRDAINFNYSGNGAIIPVSIAKRVIKAVEDRCPIFAGATRFGVKGTLKLPVYGPDASGNDVTVGYTSDFTPLSANAGVFTSVELTGYLIGGLTLIGKSLLNSSDIDLTSFVIGVMADKLSGFIEKELLVGTTNKCTGVLSCTNGITAAATTVITSDELITLQTKVKQAYQGKAVWTMSSDTFTTVKKIKDGNGRYLLQDDFTQGFSYRLLGKPVFISDNMPAIAAGAKPILYGDYSGLAVNVRENVSIDILREAYATQHAIGVYSYLEMDSKVTDAQKLAVLTMHAA